MNLLGFLPVNLMSLASVGFCVWMFFTSAHFRKPLEGKFEITLARDGRNVLARYDLRLQLRYDDSGRLLRWVRGRPVHSDKELRVALALGLHEVRDLPVGIDALGDMSWGEIVRTVGLCEKWGFRVEFVAPIASPRR